MIETLFSQDALSSPAAFALSLLIGVAFGFVLEQAGFGSSRRLAGIFYFRDMAVLKVMFSGLVTTMLGVAYLVAFGWLTLESIYQMPTVYVAQIVGGLVFGVGFVLSGWCPGTAAVGMASGRLDALLCLVGAVVGSIVFNEAYPAVAPLMADSGVQFIYTNLGLSQQVFALLLTIAAVAAFWVGEYIEHRRKVESSYFNSPSLKGFGVALVVFAIGLFIVRPTPAAAVSGDAPPSALPTEGLLAAIEAGHDHIEPEELAERLISGNPDLLVVDVRPQEEFSGFHIRGAVNVPLSALEAYLDAYKNRGLIVLYSNGMTHPAQVRDYLHSRGFQNAYILTDGLAGFIERCLKPASLRSGPLAPEAAAAVTRWREYFLSPGTSGSQAAAEQDDFSALTLPGLTTTDWLAENYHRGNVRIIDLRSHTEYTSGHIPGSLRLDLESLRGVIGGVPSMLMPASMIGEHLSLMGIHPADVVVLVSGDKLQDATIMAMALERVGHNRYLILDGGFGEWLAEERPTDTALPSVAASEFPVDRFADHFTVDYQTVLQHMERRSAVIIDVRPAEYYSGTKSDEARAGHIPGALSRPYTEDVLASDKYKTFKPIDELRQAYRELIPSHDATVIVHCRTGHQASQTFFVLKRLLGYRNVLWYDAGWTEWAARPELPVRTGATP
ncbi:MAG: rhodanese-like domain-containing protein [Phycisphaerae bacterium]